MEIYDGDMYRGWAEYVVYGGLPLTVAMKTEEQKISYLTNLFKETYLKDIIEKHNIEKTQELEDLINILASAIGSLTNPPRIEATFKSAIQSTISLNTITFDGKYYLQRITKQGIYCRCWRWRKAWN